MLHVRRSPSARSVLDRERRAVVLSAIPAHVRLAVAVEVVLAAALDGALVVGVEAEGAAGVVARAAAEVRVRARARGRRLRQEEVQQLVADGEVRCLLELLQRREPDEHFQQGEGGAQKREGGCLDLVGWDD